ncbi:hypothetical protein [Marinobacter caseinilyticus]|uniref:hypothetical protein n=1 Tax=Marinobacter caseinilyticus TaxID=2692195 RepID=UPI00140B2F2F|nr:hypothetical protein [Marinobacter caseinilyticus]
MTYAVRRCVGLLAIGTVVLCSGTAAAHGVEEIKEVPPGRVVADLETLPEIDGLRVMLLDGVPQGILVSYHGDRELVVQGLEGEPFLRFDADGVMVNTGSVTWRASQSAAMKARDNGDGQWKQVSGSSSYGWMDPRLRLDQAPAPSAERTAVGAWQIAIALADEAPTPIAGRLYWQPRASTEPPVH